jgi:hypothetical protein
MSMCALLSGLALIKFYTWNLGVYKNLGYYCYPYDSWCKCTRSLFMVIRASIH